MSYTYMINSDGGILTKYKKIVSQPSLIAQPSVWSGLGANYYATP